MPRLATVVAAAALLAACGTVSDEEPDPANGNDGLRGLEAETAAVADAFVVRVDAGASGGEALEHTGNADANAELPVTVDATGEYALWVRMFGADEDSDAIEVRFGGEEVRAHPDETGEYRWVEIGHAALEADAEHALTLGSGEAGARIDVFAVVADREAGADDLERHFMGDGSGDSGEGAGGGPDEPQEPDGGSGGSGDGSGESDEGAGGGNDAAPHEIVQEPDVLYWSQVGEWSLRADEVDGNPYDVPGTVTFTHADGTTRTTSMFHDGDGRWAFRFPAMRTGTWSYRTSSRVAELDGRQGQVRVEANGSDANGLLRADGARLLTRTDNGTARRGVINNVYMPSTDDFDNLGELPEDPEARGPEIEALLDEAEHNGFPGLMVRVYNSWFSYGDKSYEDHDEENPDRQTFEVLEDLAMRAHARGMFVHLWAWGDESRQWTPIGVGGINGEADTRLQRYIGARLGSLPGWTMSYGFDLNEWVDPDEVRAWERTIRDHAIVDPLVMAREVEDRFELGDDGLAVNSIDDRPDSGFYALARERLAEGDPVLFERRFLYGRDGIWDAETTRRALWQFTMAGGAGAIWGPGFEGTEPYPNPEQLRIHAAFWDDRFDPALQATSDADAEGDEELTLRAPDDRLVVTYREDTDRVTLDLSGVPDGYRAIAVDARGDAYEEIEIGPFDGDTPTWTAGHESDWVIAVTAD